MTVSPRRFGARRRAAWGLALSLGAMALLFSLWPTLDLVASRWFYDAARGFVAAEWPLVRWSYEGTPWVTRTWWLTAIVMLLVGALRPAWVPRHLRRRAGMLALCGLFGAGLVVDSGFKNHWGRPRPVQVAAFGGPSAFQPALRPADVCKRNCSFPSGHAAGAYALMAWGALGAPRTRRRWWCIGVAAGSIVGFGRMLQGGHFLGDVLWAGLMIWAVCVLIRALWLRVAAHRRRARRAANEGAAMGGAA